jgi:hypothetical protein
MSTEIERYYVYDGDIYHAACLPTSVDRDDPDQVGLYNEGLETSHTLTCGECLQPLKTVVCEVQG